MSPVGESALKSHMKSEGHVKKSPVKHPSSVKNLFDVQKENVEPVSVEQLKLKPKSALLGSPTGQQPNICDMYHDLLSLTIWRLYDCSNACKCMLMLFSTSLLFLSICMSQYGVLTCLSNLNCQNANQRVSIPNTQQSNDV